MAMRRMMAFIALIVALASFPARADSLDDGLSERERALHVLNRLAFGPRAGDVDRVLDLGVDRWIEQQLHPLSIDDAEVEASLASLETLRMSSAELFETYQQPVLEARAEMRRRASEGEDVDSEEQTRQRIQRMRGERDPRQPLAELTTARVTRAVSSERQLNEVMVDFWMNHFNVFAGKQPVGVLLTEYEYDVIRPNIWGSFEELLLATARSPAMLAYLDNMRSVAEMENRPSRSRPRISMRGRGNRGGVFGGQGRSRRPAGPRERQALQRLEQAGLNENYARELMELHTLGVDGGYAQDDVVALARILTGWSIERPGEGTGFVFRRELHDIRGKTFLGETFRAGGGFEEGERAIRMLARHPSTARHIATKLVQYLVADEAPGSLVDRVAARFTETGGNLRETVRAVVTSPEFFDRDVYRAKTKTPFEFVVSSLRATGAEVEPRFVFLQLREMGEPLYLCQPPTGYSDLSEDWISSAQLMSRINFGTALASGRIVEIDEVPGEIDDAALQLTGERLLETTRASIEQQLTGEKLETIGRGPLLTGLILGSPDFQQQ